MALTVDDTIATASGTSDSSGNSTVNIPDSLVAGDLVYVVYSNAGGGTAAWPSSPLWTEQGDANNGNAQCVSIAYRRVTGTEGWGGTGNTITVVGASSSKFAAGAIVIGGAEDPATTAPQASSPATGNDAAPNPPASPTPSGGSLEYLFVAVAGWANKGTYTSPPTDYATQVSAITDGAGAPAGNGGCAIATRLLTTSSAQDPGTFAVSASGEWVTYTVVVHPAGDTTVQLEGTAAGTSGQTAALSTDRPVAGSSAGTGGQTAALSTDRPLAASAGGTSGQTAALSVKRATAGATAAYSAPGSVSFSNEMVWGTTADAESFQTVSFTSAAGDLQTVVAFYRGTTLTPSIANDTYGGLTYTLVEQVEYATNAWIGVWVADKLVTTETGSQTITLDFTGDNYTVITVEVNNLVGAPVAGLAAVRQTAEAAPAAGTDVVTTTFASAATGANIVTSHVLLINTQTEEVSPPTGANWTQQTSALSGPNTRFNTGIFDPTQTADEPAFTGTTILWPGTTTVQAIILSVEWNTVRDAIDVKRAVAGTAAGSAGQIAALSTDRSIIGTAAGTGGQSAALDADRPIAGTTGGTGGSSADLTVSAGIVDLEGTSAGTGGQSAALAVDRGLVGTAAGTAGQAADVDVDRPLAATAAGVGGQVAALSTDRSIAATAAGVGGQSATLDTDRALAGTAAGAAGQTAAASVDRPLAATAGGTGGSTADLTVTGSGLVDLEGTSAAMGGQTADLYVARPIAATAAAAGGQVASLGVTRPIAGTVAAMGGQTADLSRIRSLVATASGSSGQAASVIVRRGLAATAAGSSGQVGDLSVARALSAILAASSSATAALSISGVDAAADALLNGSLTTAIALAGTSTASVSLTGAVTAKVSLMGDLN